jgi:hypothetical protein
MLPLAEKPISTFMLHMCVHKQPWSLKQVLTLVDRCKSKSATDNVSTAAAHRFSRPLAR